MHQFFRGLILSHLGTYTTYVHVNTGPSGRRGSKRGREGNSDLSGKGISCRGGRGREDSAPGQVRREGDLFIRRTKKKVFLFSETKRKKGKGMYICIYVCMHGICMYACTYVLVCMYVRSGYFFWQCAKISLSPIRSCPQKEREGGVSTADSGARLTKRKRRKIKEGRKEGRKEDGDNCSLGTTHKKVVGWWRI